MLSSRLNNLVPYVPGEQPQDKKYIKLNTNENPYPPSPLIDRFLHEVQSSRLRLYPDPNFVSLREIIADKYSLKPSQVFVGNGSDEVLAFAFYAFFDTMNGDLLFPEFTYSFYPVYGDLFGIRYKKTPLAPDFNIDLARMIEHAPSSGVIFPNPNAPTGILISIDQIRKFLDAYRKDRVVIIDEAYIDFGGESAVSLLQNHKNLLIVRTLSKSLSLAGIRIGFAMGDETLIQGLFRVKDSFNSYPANTLSQEIAKIAVADEPYFRKIVEKIIATRNHLSTELTRLGWEVLPSSANFVFTRKKGVHGKGIYLLLKEKGILVRHFNTPGIEVSHQNAFFL